MIEDYYLQPTGGELPKDDDENVQDPPPTDDTGGELPKTDDE